MARHGENIRLRRDGRWEARVPLGRRPQGGTRYKYLYAGTYTEVRQKKAEYMVRGPEPALAPPVQAGTSVTFGEAASLWLAAKKPQVKPATYSCYAVQLERQLLPELGPVPLAQLDGALLERFLLGKLEGGCRRTGEGLSPKSVTDLRTILLQVLKYAKARGLLAAVPDCPSVAGRQPPISVLTEQEQEALVCLAVEEDTPMGLGVLAALYAGLRIGEVCALRWADFDPVGGTLCVGRTLMRIYDIGAAPGEARTRLEEGRPKTDSSFRTIPLPDDIWHYFAQRRGAPDTYVLTGTKKPLEPRACRSRYKRMLQRAGVADHTFHALRHTFATRCIEKGVDVKSLSEIMGHASVTITMQRYVHPSMERKREQINRLTVPALRGQIRGQ